MLVNTHKIILVIPARFGSTRLPGKPLINIAGKTLLQRAIATAKLAIKKIENSNINILVATDNNQILAHAKQEGVAAVMTLVTCKTGTDRVFAAINCLPKQDKPDLILNLQGDVPFLPSEYIIKTIQELKQPNTEIATPVLQLTWQELNLLREYKKTTPLSGTMAILAKNNNAIWFSKNIIPNIRNEKELKALMPSSEFSPVYKHIGLYGYKFAALEKFVSLPESDYEKLEGLEQLRALENNMLIRAVKVTTRSRFITGGIDSPEDVARFTNLVETCGEPELI